MPATDDLTVTRESLHAVAEHVLAAALHDATGHIGLRPSPGGFATPTFRCRDADTIVAVSGTELVVRRDGVETWAPLTTIRAAAAVVGIEPGAPADVYPPATPLEPERPLHISATSAQVLADLFELTDGALTRLAADHAAERPPAAQLWPEHFDLALTLGEVNVGGCPGDDDHPLPYLYVGPWSPRQGAFWNEPFGASLQVDRATSVDDAVAFFERGLSCAAAEPA